MLLAGVKRGFVAYLRISFPTPNLINIEITPRIHGDHNHDYQLTKRIVSPPPLLQNGAEGVTLVNVMSTDFATKHY
jgi:hypothetical protein